MSTDADSHQIPTSESVATLLCALPECGRAFKKSRQRHTYCSPRCRSAAWDKAHPRQQLAIALGCGPRKKRDVGQEFARWIATGDGLTVYSEVRDRALRLLAAGWKHYGIAALFEAIRYDSAVRLGPDADGLRLNDRHRSRLARLLMEREPALAGFFSTRKLRAA